MTLLIAAAVGLPSNADSPDEIVVFVNKSISVNSISLSELKQIFLKRKTSWPGGDNIVCINVSDSSPLRELFRGRVLEMTKEDEQRYWTNQKIRFQLSPPAEMDDTPKAVFKLRNAIGYAARKDVPQGVVKIVAVIP